MGKVTDAPRQTDKKKMAQMTKHFKAPEKIQLSDEEIANLSEWQNIELEVTLIPEPDT